MQEEKQRKKLRKSKKIWIAVAMVFGSAVMVNTTFANKAVSLFTDLLKYDQSANEKDGSTSSSSSALWNNLLSQVQDGSNLPLLEAVFINISKPS